jgi:hypothetical protein
MSRLWVAPWSFTGIVTIPKLTAPLQIDRVAMRPPTRPLGGTPPCPRHARERPAAVW